MDVAVLKYLYITINKPVGIPDEWPGEVVNLDEGVPFPPDARTGWLRMTPEEYSAHIAANQASYDIWVGSSVKQQSFVSIDNPSISFDDFSHVSATGTGRLGWQITSSGSGATGLVGVSGESNTRGVAGLTTGTTTTGRSARYLVSSDMHFGQGVVSFLWRIRIPALSDSTNRFITYIGWGDTSAAGDMVDGVYFTYSDTINSGNWTLNTASSSMRTTFNSGVLVDTTWVKLLVTVNADATSAAFYINDVLVGSISTNIPNTSAKQTGSLTKIEKSVGTTARTLLCDYYYDSVFFTLAR
jgi:hypothetical protein